jgi:diaminohydroxyphosphoribosylaminopyrimidine deaminase/5-amino-6-(5-phosphoribosylamino)uracil reductase
VFTENESADEENLKFIKLDFSQNILPQMMEELYRREVLSVIVEGGSELLTSFLAIGLWDEAFVYTGNQFFGKGVAAPHILGKTVAYRKLDDCKLHVLKRI